MAAESMTDRRRFLKHTATLAAGAIALPTIVPARARGADGATAPSERSALGHIGTGGRGGSLLSNFLGQGGAQVRAVCDVKQAARERARKMVNGRYRTEDCAVYSDLRKVVARDDIDAVVIATPDHWHVAAALMAVRAGKDVYVEKPLGLSVEQGKVLRREVGRYGTVLQFGTQERSSRHTRFACEMVRSGRIGQVRKITVASRYSVASGNYPPMPVPDWLDYEMWLGPAPWAPYTANRVINNHWFHISDYAVGFIAGCGIHTVDMAQWGNGTDHTGPLTVEGTGEFPADGLCNCATGWDMNLEFANGVTMNFTDGKRNKLGVLFEGDEGWVFVKETHLGGRVDANPKSMLHKPIGANEVHLRFSDHHQRNFLDCIKSRGKPVAPIEIAVRSDTLVHISDIAMRLGRKLRWDSTAERFVNDAEANRMLSRLARDPWHL